MGDWKSPSERALGLITSGRAVRFGDDCNPVPEIFENRHQAEVEYRFTRGCRVVVVARNGYFVREDDPRLMQWSLGFKTDPLFYSVKLEFWASSAMSEAQAEKLADWFLSMPKEGIEDCVNFGWSVELVDGVSHYFDEYGTSLCERFVMFNGPTRPVADSAACRLCSSRSTSLEKALKPVAS
jgi:hypothetical protein